MWQVASETKQCPNCREALQDQARFCPHCEQELVPHPFGRPNAQPFDSPPSPRLISHRVGTASSRMWSRRRLAAIGRQIVGCGMAAVLLAMLWACLGRAVSAAIG